MQSMAFYRAEIKVLRKRLVATTKKRVKPIIKVDSELMVVIVPRLIVPST